MIGTAMKMMSQRGFHACDTTVSKRHFHRTTGEIKKSCGEYHHFRERGGLAKRENESLTIRSWGKNIRRIKVILRRPYGKVYRVATNNYKLVGRYLKSGNE